MRSHLRKTVLSGLAALSGLTGFGCLGGGEVNPFLTFTETFGASQVASEEQEQGAGSAAAATDSFRRSMTLTLANNHPEAELNVNMLAWVSPASIRTAEQQDALLRSNYVQISSEVRIGTSVTLAPGTFVFNGPGIGGATPVALPSTGAAAGAPVDPANASTRTFDLVTPDALLLFSQPPVSCESVAFVFTIDGEPLTSAGNSGLSASSNLFAGPNSAFSGYKTLSQVDVYQCSPLKPGLFLKIGGGAVADNEYLEGQNIRVDFSQIPDANNNFAFVTRTGP